MSTPVKPIPEGFHSITPYLTIRGAAEAIDFYRDAFGAKERYRLAAPDGKSIGHAELLIGNSIVMLSDEFPDCGRLSPLAAKGTSIVITLYVPDADAVFKKAVELGARAIQPVDTKFYGDRAGCLADPFGHEWMIMTHVEDVPFDEMKKRMKDFYAKMAANK